jgi:hypothetical protein
MPILRYDKSDAWRIQLEDVLGRTGVQIHVGNLVAQSKGCILVGSRLEAGSPCRAEGSKPAYLTLKKEGVLWHRRPGGHAQQDDQRGLGGLTDLRASRTRKTTSPRLPEHGAGGGAAPVQGRAQDP